VWNWTCAADADPAADKFEPRRAGAGRDAHRRVGQPRRPCRRSAARARAGRAHARRRAVDRRHGSGPPPPPAGMSPIGAVDAAQLFSLPLSPPAPRTSPPGCAPLRRPRAPTLCASAVGGAAPAPADRSPPSPPSPRSRPSPGRPRAAEAQASSSS
jgi:hypothetical protein